MKKREDLIYNRCGICGIKNIVNNKVYVGQTGNNFGDRWDVHRALLRKGAHHNSELQKDWMKNGENNFQFFVIEDCETNVLNDRERFFVAEYRSKGLSYNITDGGSDSTFTGKHLPEDVKRKIGEKNKINSMGRHASEETRKKMSESHKGKLHGPMSDEQKAALSKSHQNFYEMHPKKLTTENVIEIRELRRAGATYASIAKQFGVTHQCISDICNYKRWKQIQ